MSLTEALASDASIPAARVAALSLLAVVRVEQGQASQAQELARAAGQLVADNDLGGTQQGSVAYTAAGAVYAEHGRPEEADKEFEHALRIRRRWFGISPWPVIDTMLRMAPVPYDLGDPPAATALLSEASNMLAAWPDGAKAQWARLHRLERRNAASPRTAAGERLTEREVTVLQLLPTTLSLREIGQQLHVSPNTVKTHTKAIYRKLDVSTRHDAVARGHGIGILWRSGRRPLDSDLPSEHRLAEQSGRRPQLRLTRKSEAKEQRRSR